MKELQIIPFAEITEQVWTDFHQSCVDPVIFYQYPFLEAYSKATNERVDILLYMEGGKLLIALPGKFDKKSKIFSNLTYLGWDNLNLLVDSGVQENTLGKFFKELFTVVDLVVYKNISRACHQTIQKHMDGSIDFKGFRCPFINLPNSYDDYLETLSVSFKRMIKNRTNFCQKHGVEFRFVTNANKESLEKAFLELNQLHGIRMDEVDLESKFLKSDSQKFHELLQAYNNEKFILIIQAVEGEKVIGTLYGFVSSNRYAYFASGIDPDYSKYSLGIVLIGKVIDYLISNNYEYFDFLRGTEEYKFRWTEETNQNYTVYSFDSIKGRYKAIKTYWDENKIRYGRKQTLLNLKEFF